MESSSGVRVATAVGREAVDVLAAAFADDPWMRWALPDSGAARSLFSLFLRTVALPHGIVLVAGDPVEGVAVLMPPDVVVPDDPAVGEVVMGLHGPRLGAALDAEAVIQRHRPTGSDWTLHSLGVRPDSRNRGIGAALLSQCLELAGGQPVTLETSSKASRDWYLLRGFAETDVIDLSGHGLGADAPTVWLLEYRP